MSIPHLLLVDDSEAILAYEAAALSSHYTLSTATNGRDALEKLREIRPAAVLLDLSMPDMTGDDLLARMQADPVLCRIPVVVVSSERERGVASTERGARAFLAKPIRAVDLQALVARVLEQERVRSRGDEFAVLFLGVGPLEIGIPLDPVREVLPQPMTQSAASGPDYLCQTIDYRGTSVRVLDLAPRLRVPHSEPLHERKLVVVAIDGQLLALTVDGVRAPEAFPSEDVLRRPWSDDRRPARGIPALVAIVKTLRGPVPVIDPGAFLYPDLLFRLSEYPTQMPMRER